MTDKNAPRLRHPDVFLLSFAGVGFLPKAPGTWGTLATIPFLYLISSFNPPFFIFIPSLFVFTFLACVICEYTQKRLDLHDPGWIVIDESLGMATTWIFLDSLHWFHILLVFGLFRFFDIFKIWPASFFDKDIKHGAGTIIDDIVSGLYAGIAYKLIIQIYFWITT